MPLADSNTTGLVVISMFAIVVGFLVLGLLFYGMVYKPSREEKREREAEELGGIDDRRS